MNKVKSKVTTVRVPLQLHNKLKEAALSEKKSVNKIINYILSESVEKYLKKECEK